MMANADFGQFFSKKNIQMQENQLLQQEISLKQIELLRVDLPQKKTFVSGIGVRKSKETLLVKWTDKSGRIGYGECSCRPDPYYSDEFLDAAMIMIQKFVLPHLQATQTYQDVLNILKRIRGWNFTKSAIEAAIYEIVKQQSDYTIGDALKRPMLEQVPVGISLGIYEDPEEFKEVVQNAIDTGYHRLKFKISPSVDTKNFDAINPILFDNNVYVSFDANGSYYEEDIKKLGYFVNTYNNAIEQPTPPNRFDIFMKAKEIHPNLKVCFDEQIKNIGDLVEVNALNMIDELNLKVGRVGGITNSIRILKYCFKEDIPVWVGGMFETGVGRLQNLEFASYLEDAQAHDMSPSSRYFKEDILSEEVTMDDGYIDVNETMQYDVDPETVAKYTTNKIVEKK